MSDQMDDLQSSLSALENTLSRISGMSTVDEITIEGMSIYELRESAAATANAHQLYLQNVPEAMRDQVTFQVFLTSPAVGLDAATAAQMNVLWNQMESDPDFWDKLDQADTVNEVIDGVNGKISEVNRLLKQYDMMLQLVKQMSGNSRKMKKFAKMGGMPGMPGMGGFPGM